MSPVIVSRTFPSPPELSVAYFILFNKFICEMRTIVANFHCNIVLSSKCFSRYFSKSPTKVFKLEYACFMVILSTPRCFNRVISDPVGMSGQKIAYELFWFSNYLHTTFHYNQLSSYSWKNSKHPNSQTFTFIILIVFLWFHVFFLNTEIGFDV